MGFARLEEPWRPPFEEQLPALQRLLPAGERQGGRARPGPRPRDSGAVRGRLRLAVMPRRCRPMARGDLAAHCGAFKWLQKKCFLYLRQAVAKGTGQGAERCYVKKAGDDGSRRHAQDTPIESTRNTRNLWEKLAVSSNSDEISFKRRASKGF